MLVQISVTNLVLIERLALEFTSGFNVITGETGAGKSMLVEAVSLVLGGRARPDLRCGRGLCGGSAPLRHRRMLEVRTGRE